MPPEVIAPDATNPDQRANVDPSLDPNQLDDLGNPKPPAPKPAPKPAPDKPAEKPGDTPKADPDKGKTPDNADKEDNDDTPLDVATWGTTNSETGDAVLTLLQNSGIAPSDAKALLFDAVQNGDVTKIDKAALEAKVGKVKAHLIMVGAENFVKEQRDNAKAVVSELHKEVGGEANWKTIAEWANKSVPAEELQEFRDMINKGGLPAKLAANALKQKYEGDTNNSSLTVEETLPGGKPPEAPTYKPMSRVEYSKEVEKLHAKHFGNPPQHLRQALLNARQAGARLGM